MYNFLHFPDPFGPSSTSFVTDDEICMGGACITVWMSGVCGGTVWMSVVYIFYCYCRVGSQVQVCFLSNK